MTEHYLIVMADIRLINILPPQTVSGVQQPQGTQGAPSHAVPTTLGNLAVGSIVSGFIVNRDASGNPILRTDKGDVVFSTNFFLKIGSEVVIRIENPQLGSLAHILSVDGNPPEVAETLSAFSQEPEVIVGRNQTPSQTLLANITSQATDKPASLTPPTIMVNGTLLSSPATNPSLPLPMGSANLPAGTQLVLKVVALQAAPTPSLPDEIMSLASPPSPASSNASPAQPATISYAAYARAASTPLPSTFAVPLPLSPSATNLPLSSFASAPPISFATPLASVQVNPIPLSFAGTIADLFTSVNNPSNTATFNSNAPISIPVTTNQPNMLSNPITLGQLLTATVINNEPVGQAFIQTPIGIVRLEAGSALPSGSTVTLEIVQVTPPQTGILTNLEGQVDEGSAPLTELALHWNSLQQIYKLLSDGMMPGLDIIPGGMSLSQQVNPNQSTITPQNLSTGLLFFMAALKGGDFSAWLGKTNVKWLEDRGYGDLVKKAHGEFQTMSRQFTEAPQQQWQSLFFPIAVDGMLEQVRLYIKRDRKQGGGQQAKNNEDTRFIVEVDLTQLGEIQMDGFIRRREKEVQFDLMIRSLNQLSSEIQQDIFEIYNNTGAITGYKGNLVFQSVKEFPVNPMDEIATHMGPVVA